MSTRNSWFRGLLLAGLLITLSCSAWTAEPAQTSTAPAPPLVLGAPHTLSLPAAELSIRYPEDWSLVHPTANSWAILNVSPDQLETVQPTVRVQITYLRRNDHAAAVSELADIAKEYATPPTFLAISGWPALERVQRLKRPQPSQAPRDPDPYMVQITTAVAAGNLLIRLDGRLPSYADQELLDLVLKIGRSLTFSSLSGGTGVEQEIEQLEKSSGPTSHSSIPLQSAAALSAPENVTLDAGPSEAAGANPILTLNSVPFGSNGELEIAASNDGANIVMVKQSSWLTSNDGGQTFPFSGSLPVQDGDSSIAFGNTGNFYHSALSCFGSSCAAVCPANSNCAEIAVSTDNGQNFGALINAAVCPNSGGGACSIDQEHIAADRFATVSNQDRVYMGFRECQGGCGSNSRITCSMDSGATWAPQLALEGGADFPRVAVGSDGSFYVVYQVGANIRLDKYNACSTNAAVMTRAAGGFPKTVSAFNTVAGCGVANGFPGLDRCNNGNLLSSPTVAVDDTNANHVYVAWATNTATGPSPGLGNENVMVADSIDGGVTWGAMGHAPVIVNSTASNGRRIMPWVCPSGGKAFVTWYDRRNATAANNDLQDYFAASAGLSSGSLVASNDEFMISTTTDATCTTWPRGPRSTFDSENCSVQPQNAGTCSMTTGIRCDFAGGGGTPCPTGETCQTGNGAVKYGDYNGNYCVLGRLYTVFASSTGQPTNGAPQNFYQSFVVTSTPTTAVYNGATTGDYHDDVTLAGRLTLSGTSIGIAGQTLSFTIGTQSCNGVTTGSGAASCVLTLNQLPGAYMVTASFGGAGLYNASSVDTPFTITKEETTLSYTGPTVIANGTSVTLSGVLLEDGLVPIVGRSVSFTLGTGGSAQTCAGTTDATGSASCTIPVVSQPLGANTVAGSFIGDAYYLPSSVSGDVISFAFPARGDFVVGDGTATDAVEFWGDDWASVNALSGGPAPAAFKGFAAGTSTPPACGTAWTSRPGNSSNPPNSPLPSYMGVIVSSAVAKSGPTMSGNVFKIVVVTTNPGYEGNPGHHGTGTVVATYCQ